MKTHTQGERQSLPRYAALNRYGPYAFVLLQGLIYGFGDPISKEAFSSVSVYSLLTVRYLIALGVMGLFAGRHIWQGLKNSAVRDWLAPTLCLGAAYVCGNMAIGMTEATAVAFIRSLSTVLAPLLALVLYRKKYSWKHIPIQVMVVVGLYLLCGKGGLSGVGWGEILALLTALLLAASLVFGEKALNQVDPITLSALQTAASAVMSILCAFLLEGGVHLAGAGLSVWGIILYLAIFCTIIGYLLQNGALSRIPARTVALLQCFCPVMTALFSRLLLGEQLSLWGVAGAIILLGCVTIETAMGE
jgi:drug/metabolite transporter (DMT)-like permease